MPHNDVLKPLAPGRAELACSTQTSSDLQLLFGFGEKVQSAVQDLKKNVDEAAAQKDDAAEKVVAESPGKSQEDNAEKVRREAGESNLWTWHHNVHCNLTRACGTHRKQGIVHAITNGSRATPL